MVTRVACAVELREELILQGALPDGVAGECTKQTHISCNMSE